MCRGKDSISVILDGNESLRYSGDVQEFSTPARWSTIESQVPFMGALFSRFRIPRIEVQPIPGSGK